MTLAAGSRLGPYEIQSALGAGGMGEVYRARDPRLDRTVAIKVLPSQVATDPALRARFEREARTVAGLNHPHICVLHDVGHDDGIEFIVMEYLDGETLAQRLAKGQMPLDQALALAIQIASALNAAHRAGIVHRDLKPGNVMLTKSGAKLLDFGLAKVTPSVIATSGLSMAPTGVTPLTAQGTILGTLQDMAPEQIEGQEADARTDIFAFGCILYEMLSGRKAFEGKSQASLIGAILKVNPQPLTTIQPLVSPALAQMVKTCLAKDPDERWQTAADIARQLQWIAEGGSQSGLAAPVMAPRRSVLRDAAPLIATAGIVAVVSLAAAWRLMRADDRSPQPVTRFVLASPEGVAPRGAGAGRHLLALSPQGTHLVYWANNQLYLRAMDSLEQAKPIPGTEGAREPFFSADGQWIGFFQGQLKKVSVRGGAVMRVADANLGYGANWEADNQVFFGLGPEGIWRVPGTGGTPEKVIAVKDGEEAHGPQELPDGSILYTLRPKGTTSWDDAQIVVEPRGGARTVLIRGGRDARYLRTGHLIYGVNGVLYAVPFDASSHTIRGGAVPVAEGVMDADIRTGAMHYSVSADDGSLAYVIGASGERATLVFIDRQGRPMSLPGDPLDYARPRISPDGTRVALEVGAGDNRNLRIYDLARFTLTRLTADSLRAARYALWTRDGQRVVFFSDSDGGGLFSQAADGTGTTTRLTTSAAEQMPYAWSVDGRTLVFEQGTTGTLNTIGLYLLPLEGPRIATPLLRSTGDNQPALSPDGRWMA